MSSLEILDLSHNRLQTLPDEIRNMTSLKVFAVQKNRLERLPTSLGEINSLMVLKVEDNPLVFPPAEILSADDEPPTGTSERMTSERLMLHITTKIKKYLRQHANSTNGRSRGQIDSDGELR
jgi:Leucine Rich Repeat (LRR) protein